MSVLNSSKKNPIEKYRTKEDKIGLDVVFDFSGGLSSRIGKVEKTNDFILDNKIKASRNNSIFWYENDSYLPSIPNGQQREYPINLAQQSNWSMVTSIGVRYKLTKLSDLMLDLRWQYYFSDWIDGFNHKLSYNKFYLWKLQDNYLNVCCSVGQSVKSIKYFLKHMLA